MTGVNAIGFAANLLLLALVVYFAKRRPTVTPEMVTIAKRIIADRDSGHHDPGYLALALATMIVGAAK